MVKPYKRINFNFHPKLEHGRLYSLSPIGVSTPMIESLLSYITRLAQAHCVTVGILISREIAPVIKKDYLTTERSRKVQSGSMIGVIKAMEGTGQIATDWVRAVEELTLKKNIHLLTMLPFKEVFLVRNLLKNKRVWCSFCLEDFKENKQTVYECLLWRLKIVSFCPIHNVPLENSCNNCHRGNQPILASHMRTGFCHYCKHWLGHSDYKKVCSVEKGIFQTAISKSISDVLAENEYLSPTLIRNNIVSNIKTCVNLSTNGNKSKFAQLTKVPIDIIHDWTNGANSFRLDLLAQICVELDISLYLFLTDNIGSSDILPEINIKPLTKKAANSRPVDLVKMKNVLESAIRNKSNVVTLSELAKNSGFNINSFKRYFPELYETLKKLNRKYKQIEQKQLLTIVKSALNEYPPPSVFSLSKRINKSTSTLHHLFPELCHEITKNHKSYEERLRNNWLLALREELTQIVLKLHNDGVYPSRDKVGQLMNKPGSTGTSSVRKILREIKQRILS